MNRRTLNALIVSLLISTVAITLGLSIIQLNYNASVKSIDVVLNQDVLDIKKSGKAYLSAALVLTKENPIQVGVSFSSDSAGLVILKDSPAVVTRKLNPTEFKDAQKHSVTLDLGSKNRIRALDLGENQQLILSVSLEPFQKNRESTTRFLWIVALLIFAAVQVLARVLTYRRQLQVSAQELNAEREVKAKMQEFLGNASHELRTPLTVIHGYVELMRLRGKAEDEQSQRQLDRIYSEIKRMEELINELLLLAQLGEEQEIDMEEFDLIELSSGFIQDAQLLQPARPITVETPPVLNFHGSRRLISQVFSNIWSNARRHTPEDAPVEFRIERVGGEVRIEYQDGGPGLPEEFSMRDVQQFFRYDKSRSRTTGGAGLGLSLTQAIVQAHGGRMEVGRSSLGGFRLIIELPNQGE